MKAAAVDSDSEAFSDERIGGDPGDPHDFDEAPTAAKANPFLKFAYQSPRPSTRSSADRSVSQSPGKRKDTTCDGVDDVCSGSQLDLPDSTKISERNSPSHKSRKKVKRYDHLQPLNDNLAPGLDIVFCGINPGEQSARIGHHFGNPRNHFWGCLYESGLTSRKLDPREDFKMPEQFSIGLTNLVERTTAQQSELSRNEQIEGVAQLLTKIIQYQPRVVCFVGLGIADIVKSKVLGKKGAKLKTDVGLQAYKMIHSSNSNSAGQKADSLGVETLFYAVSSTSGRVVKYQKPDKVQQFKDLRELIERLKKGDLCTTQFEVISNPTHVDGGV